MAAYPCENKENFPFYFGDMTTSEYLYNFLIDVGIHVLRFHSRLNYQNIVP